MKDGGAMLAVMLRHGLGGCALLALAGAAAVFGRSGMGRLRGGCGRGSRGFGRSGRATLAVTWCDGFGGGSVRVPAGVAAVFGRSGAGKTSRVEAVAGSLHPDMTGDRGRPYRAAGAGIAGRWGRGA